VINDWNEKSVSWSEEGREHMTTQQKIARGGGDKEQRILDAAKVLFTRYGLKKTSIEEIAQYAGLGKGTIYLYFKSKDDIFLNICGQIRSTLMLEMEENLRPLTLPQEKLRMLIYTRLRFFDRLAKEFGLTDQPVIEREYNPALENVKMDVSRVQISLIRDIIEEGKQRGDFQTESSEVSAFGIYYAVEALGKPWQCGGRVLDLDEKINATVNLFLNGLLRR
jgi:AcrR family transcriptional regulator